MGVTFTWAGCSEDKQIKLSHTNAVTMLRLLGFDVHSEDIQGELEAATLAIRCEDLLKSIETAPSLDTGIIASTGVEYSRPPGYITWRAQQLLTMAQEAGPYAIYFH